MKEKEKIQALAVFSALLIVMLLSSVLKREGQTVHAQSNQEVPLYKIADIPDNGIYKLVHHGCALYIIKEQQNSGDWTHPNVPAVAIATGEGCK